MKGWKTVFYENENQKKAGVPVLISDKLEFKIKKDCFKRQRHGDQGINLRRRCNNCYIQNTRVSASAFVLPTSIQSWFPLRLTGLISLVPKRLSGVFSNSTVRRNQPLGIYPEKNMVWKHSCIPMFIVPLFTIAKTWRQSKCSLTEKWLKKMCHIHTMEYYLAIKNQWNNAICSNIDRPKDCHSVSSNSEK